MLLMLRNVGPAEFGTFSLLVAIELVVIYLSGLEFHTFTTRRYAKHPGPRQLRICLAAHKKLLHFTLPLVTVATVASLVLLRVHLDTPAVVGFLLVVVSGAIAQELIRFMVLTGKPVQAVGVTSIRGAAWMPFMIPFLHVGSLITIAVVWAVFSSVGTAWAAWNMRIPLATRSRVKWRYLIKGVRQSRSYFLISMATVVQSNLERFVLQILLGPVSVGVFSFFQTVANTLQALVTSSVINLHLSTILTAFGQSLPERFQTLKGVVIRSVLISAVLALLIVLVGYPLLAAIGREGYQSRFWMLPVLLAGQILLVATQSIHLALYGAHRDKLLLIMSVAALALSLVLDVVFIKGMGVTGAVVAPTLVSAVLAGVRWYSFRLCRLKGDV